MDIINVWPLTGKDLKKESQWRDCRLPRLNLLSLSLTDYFDSFDKVKYTCKNKEQNMLYGRGDVF